MSSNWSKQVWLVADSLGFGGIETHLLELAKGLKNHSVEVKILLLRRYDKAPLIKAKLLQHQIKLEFLDANGNYLTTLIKQVRQHKSVVLHAHGYKASLVCKLVKLLTGVKQISTYHAGETPSGRVWLYDFLDRLSAPLSDRALVVSDKIAQKIPFNATLINNFIDTQSLARCANIHADHPNIAFVGRLSDEKGPDRFIQLAKLNPALNFDMYGSGPLEVELTQIAPANVKLHGHQERMDKVWQNIGVLIICSRFEGLPMTALEAMARGIAVISFKVGNMPNLIEHQINGFLVDDLEQLNNTLRHLLTLDKTQKNKLQQQAITTIQSDYSQEAVIPQFIGLYR